MTDKKTLEEWYERWLNLTPEEKNDILSKMEPKIQAAMWVLYMKMHPQEMLKEWNALTEEQKSKVKSGLSDQQMMDLSAMLERELLQQKLEYATDHYMTH